MLFQVITTTFSSTMAPKTTQKNGFQLSIWDESPDHSGSVERYSIAPNKLEAPHTSVQRQAPVAEVIATTLGIKGTYPSPSQTHPFTQPYLHSLGPRRSHLDHHTLPNLGRERSHLRIGLRTRSHEPEKRLSLDLFLVWLRMRKHRTLSLRRVQRMIQF